MAGSSGQACANRPRSPWERESLGGEDIGDIAPRDLAEGRPEAGQKGAPG